MIDSSGVAWVFEEGQGLTKLARGVGQAASGFDAAGNYVIDLVYAGTNALVELDFGTAANGNLKANPIVRSASHTPVGSTSPTSAVAPGMTVSKMRGGIIDMIYVDGDYEGAIDGPQAPIAANVRRAV